MKKFPLIFFLGSVCALALSTWLPTGSGDKIAQAATFADQLERAKRIDPDTIYPIRNLITALRAIGKQSDSSWETRRLSTIVRLESVLAMANPIPALEKQALPIIPASDKTHRPQK